MALSYLQEREGTTDRFSLDLKVFKKYPIILKIYYKASFM